MDKYHVIIISLLVLLLILVIAGFCYWYTQKNKNNNSAEYYLTNQMNSTANNNSNTNNLISKKIVDRNIRGIEFGSNQLAEEQRIQYITHPEITDKMASENKLPEDVFNRIAQVEKSSPNQDDILSVFNQCIKSGNTFQSCLTNSGAGSQPEMCRSLCDQNYGALNKVCSSICYNQISQQNNTCRFGPC
jgi:uncharacterized protein YxeA